MPSCIFCSILSGNSPANFVYRDELCAAFMDIHPVNPGHVLVVPFAHAEMLSGVNRDVLERMLWVAQQVNTAIRSSSLRCEGVNLFLADGRVAGQAVMHVHLHVIPRYRGDGHHLRFSPAFFNLPSAAELQANAQLISKQMGDLP